MSATNRISQNNLQQRPSSMQEAAEMGERRGQAAAIAEAAAAKTLVGGMNFLNEIVAGAAGFAAGAAIGEASVSPVQVHEPTMEEIMERQAMDKQRQASALEQEQTQGQDGYGL